MTVIDHRCHRGARCANADKIKTDHCGADCDCHIGPWVVCSVPGGCGHTHLAAETLVGAEIEVIHGLCTTCERIIGDDIANLSTDYLALCEAQYSGVAGNWGEVVASSRELPIPISLTFATLAEQILVETLTFVEPVAEALNIDWDTYSTPQFRSRHGRAPAYRRGVQFDIAAALISRSMPTMLALPSWTYRLWRDGTPVEVDADGIEVALALADLHRAANATLGLTRAITGLPTPCVLCGGRTMVRVAGADGVRCTACRVCWTEDDYAQLTMILAQRPVPAAPVRELVHGSVEGTVARPAEIWRITG